MLLKKDNFNAYRKDVKKKGKGQGKGTGYFMELQNI
jgi:hypothetical protein